jgi:hypothetical protein
LGVIFVLLDPDADPLTLLNPDYIRIRNTENIVQVPTGSGKCQRGRPPSPRRGRRGGQGQRPVRRQRRDRRFAVLRQQRRDRRFPARLAPELRFEYERAAQCGGQQQCGSASAFTQSVARTVRYTVPTSVVGDPDPKLFPDPEKLIPDPGGNGPEMNFK